MSTIVAKIVVLGDQGVGKTSIVTRYVEKRLNSYVSPTVGASFFTTKFKLEGLTIQLQIWDTAGQERFKAIVPMFYRKASAAILVFDISRYESFESMKNWVSEMRKSMDGPLVFDVVGNKVDLTTSRKGVDQIFADIARKLVRISGKPPAEYESDSEGAGTLFASASELNATDVGVTETPSWSISSIAHGQTINRHCC